MRPSTTTFRWLSGLFLLAAIGLWSASASPSEFTNILRGHTRDSAAYARIFRFEHFYYLFVTFACALLWIMRPRKEITGILVGGIFGLVYPAFAIYWDVHFNWALEGYLRQSTPSYSPIRFWEPIIIWVATGLGAGGVAGMLRWINLNPEQSRVVTPVRLSMRALLLWLCVLPASPQILRVLGLYRRTGLPDDVNVSVGINEFGLGALLLAWVAGTVWVRFRDPYREVRIWSAAVLVLIGLMTGGPSLVFLSRWVLAWLLWQGFIMVIAEPRLVDSPAERPAAMEWLVMGFSTPSLILPIFVVLPLLGWFAILLTSGWVYLLSWVAVVIAFASIASRASRWTKFANLLLASGSLWFGYLWLERSHHLF